MTGETKDKTEPWVEETGMKYAYGYLTSANMTVFMQGLGMKGYPSAVLVSPKGEIVWSGHPAGLEASTIKKHLRGADRTPVDVRAIIKNWPEEAVHARKAFADGKLGKALEEAKKLPEEFTVLGDIERVIESRVGKLKTLHDNGDFLGFVDAMRGASKDLKGVDALAELEALEKSVKSDKTAKAVMKAQKQLAKLAEAVAEARKEKDLESAEKKISKLREKHPGTIVEAKAGKLSDEIRKKLEGMRRQ